jgi:hypothetical protein
LNPPKRHVALGRSKHQVALRFSLALRGVFTAIANQILARPKQTCGKNAMENIYSGREHNAESRL